MSSTQSIFRVMVEGFFYAQVEDTKGVIIVVHWRKTDNKMVKMKWEKNETQWTAKYNTENLRLSITNQTQSRGVFS